MVASQKRFQQVLRSLRSQSVSKSAMTKVRAEAASGTVVPKPRHSHMFDNHW